MIREEDFRRASDYDRQIFQTFVLEDHPLRRVSDAVKWDEFHTLLEPYYCRRMGRPADPPTMMLKLEFLRYLYRLSDREVIARAQTDIACRMFLDIPHYYRLPDPSSLCYFRGRLGQEGFRKVFDRLVGMAREMGLVRDRLRIKDASHVIADIAVPTTLQLVAQARDKLLDAAQPFDSIRVEGERVESQLLHDSTRGQRDEERLVARVTHLREILAWVDQLPEPDDAQTNRAWQLLLERRSLAHKILADREDPQAGNKTRSTTDPDARRSKHGQWYDGYMVDILVDADSEIITQINVLATNAEEAIDALELVRREEAAHGNDIEALSIDGAGYDGAVLRELAQCALSPALAGTE